jgi:8-oxo-dGTP pyrophosphatase MutT (NUDIX family)
MRPKVLGPTIGWITKSSRYIFESPWQRIRQDVVHVRGREHTFTYLERDGSVFVVPLTSSGEVVLLRSYRQQVDDWVWELPAGGINDKLGISLEAAARAELREETGYGGGDFELLASYYSAVGAMSLRFHVFLARGVERIGEIEPEDSEEIAEVACVPLAEAVRRARTGELNDGESAHAVLLAATHLATEK